MFSNLRLEKRNKFRLSKQISRVLSIVLLYSFMPVLSVIKNDKCFLWDGGTSTLLCALNFPEGESGGEKGNVVKGSFPAVLIGFNTNPFRVSLPSSGRNTVRLV